MSTEGTEFSSLSSEQQDKWLQQALDSRNKEDPSDNEVSDFLSLEQVQEHLKGENLPEAERESYQELAKSLEKKASSMPLTAQSNQYENNREISCNLRSGLNHVLDGSVTIQLAVNCEHKDADWTGLHFINPYGNIPLMLNFRPHGTWRGLLRDGVIVINSWDSNHGWHKESRYKLASCFAQGAVDGYKIEIWRRSYNQFGIHFLQPGGGNPVGGIYTCPEGSWTPAGILWYECRNVNEAIFGEKIWCSIYSD